MIAVDSGFLFALSDQSDAWHGKAMSYVRLPETEPWVCTWPVLTEACHMLRARLGPDFAPALLADVAAGSMHVWSPSEAQCEDLARLMHKYRDLPMDLADASLMLLAEHLGHGRILTTDQRDFGTYRWKSRKPFHNVLQEMAP